jgi:hypothetical protein
MDTETERKATAVEEMREWCVALPKVELHAHLNGSVRNSTLLSVLRSAPTHLPSHLIPLLPPVLDFYPFGRGSLPPLGS